MTLCTNFASYLHQPGKRLFDVGFVLVPELGGGSRLEPLSDALTGAMPVATFLYVMLFLDRRRRISETCQVRAQRSCANVGPWDLSFLSATA